VKKPQLGYLLDRLAPREELILMVLAVIIGAGTGGAAVCFIKLIVWIQNFSYGGFLGVFHGSDGLAVLLVPVAGALVVGPIIAWFASEAKGHGVPEVMQALVQRGGRIRPRVAIAKILASALCIGTGGSAGREGPIVQVGSTLGSAVGQWLRLSDERIKNLVACGAAAGIAATFNAPIAGVAFATEVLLSGLKVRMFGNVVISAVAASIVSQLFLGARPAFDVPSYAMNSPWEIVLYLGLGLGAAFLGVFFIRLLNFFEDIFEHWSFPQALKPAVGAFLLGACGFIYLQFAGGHGDSFVLPHIYGSGFHFIEEVLRGDLPFLLLFVLVFLKPLATSFTLGSGNSGGVFAPSLFTGAMFGGAYGVLACLYFPEIAGEVGAYALVGMAAVFAAAARAPFTAMLIVFEMSNGYDLILPLMAAAIFATFIAEWLHPESIYTLKLSKRGVRFAQGHDLDIMQGITVEEVMNHNPVTVHRDQPLSEVFASFQETHLQGFPVMANDEDLYGFLTIQDMERLLEQDTTINLQFVRAVDVASSPAITVYPDEPIWQAIRKMSPRDLARLPVIARHGRHKMVGLISRSDILRAYDVEAMRHRKGEGYGKKGGAGS